MSLLLQSNSKLVIKSRLADKVKGANLVIDFRDNYALKKGVVTTADAVINVEQPQKMAAYKLNSTATESQPNTLLVGSYRHTVKKGLVAQSRMYIFAKGNVVASKNYFNVNYSSDYMVCYVMGGTGSVDLYNEQTGAFIATITESNPFFDYKATPQLVSIRGEAKGEVSYFQAFSCLAFDDKVTRAAKTETGVITVEPSRYSIKNAVVQEVLGTDMVGCLVLKIHKPKRVKKIGNMSDFGESTLNNMVTTFAQITDTSGHGIYFAHYSNPENFGGMTHALRVLDQAGAEKTQAVTNKLSDVETVILAINFSKTKASAFINGQPVTSYGKPSADIEYASTALNTIYLAAGDESWSKTGDIMIEQVALYNKNLTMLEMAEITSV